MSTVEILDRREFKEQVKAQLKLDLKRTAVLTVDLHRGHLDMSVATLPANPEDARTVIAASEKVLKAARAAGLPVIHAVMTNRRLPDGTSEAKGVPFWEAVDKVKQYITPGRTSTTFEHNILGSPGTEVIPSCYEPTDMIVNSKRRLSAFYGTELEVTLRTMNINQVILLGINTNTCIQCTSFELFNRDMAPIVVAEGVNSMYGPDLHVFGLENISRCLGWVLSVEEFEAKLKEAKA